MDDHWRCRLRALASFRFAQLDPLLSSWMSSPSDYFQDFPVLANLTSEQANGTFVYSDSRQQHRRLGVGEPRTDRPCCVQVAITVQIRSHQRFPVSLLVPCVINRSITTNRIACSARLFVGSTPGVVMNRK